MTVWQQADRYSLPRICYLNKMDKPAASHEQCVHELRNSLKANPLLLQVITSTGDYCKVSLYVYKTCFDVSKASTGDYCKVSLYVNKTCFDVSKASTGDYCKVPLHVNKTCFDVSKASTGHLFDSS